MCIRDRLYCIINVCKVTTSLNRTGAGGAETHYRLFSIAPDYSHLGVNQALGAVFRLSYKIFAPYSNVYAQGFKLSMILATLIAPL